MVDQAAGDRKARRQAELTVSDQVNELVALQPPSRFQFMGVDAGGRRHCRGKEADDERMNRNGFSSIVFWLVTARVRIAWCMVGTAVYQLGFNASIQEKTFNASNPGAQITLPPLTSDANSAATSP